VVFRCFEKGYIKWVNPFNNKESYVFFDETRVIVFWTKNPEPIIPYLKVLDERNIGYYFQFTLNDYEEEGFEPNVINLRERVKIFKKLSEKIGKEKVIWRFDPLILNDQLDINKLTGKIENIAKELKGYTEKLDVKQFRFLQKIRDNGKQNLMRKKK